MTRAATYTSRPLVLALTGVTTLALPAGALAEVGAPQGTVQQAAADALFLQYAPPPATPGVVCLVDSGVDPSPDTSSSIAGSYAIDGSTDTSDELSKINPRIQPGNHPSGHGTYMAMMMAAPQNGWGMVGIAPTSVRVYNVKALPAGQTTFPFSYYANAIQHCRFRTSVDPGLVAVNLSLGNGQAPSSSDLATLQNDVAAARTDGHLNVIAAAGNTGGSVEYPAAVSGVFAVGGTDANPANLGVFCSFSNRGPQLQVLAPGCGSQPEPSGGNGVDMAFEDDGSPALGQGTSQAAALVSAALAAMRAYSPTITVSQAEQCVTSTEVRGGNLDVAQAFRACGLGSIVDQGTAAYQAANTPAPSPAAASPSAAGAAAISTPVAPPSGKATLVLPLPRLGAVTFRRHTLGVHALNLPNGAQMTVSVARRVGRRYVTIARKTAATGRMRLHALMWDRLVVRFVEPAAHVAASPATTVAHTHASRLRYVQLSGL